MYGEFYADSDLLIWPLVGLGIFVISFIAVLLYVFVGLRDRDETDRLAGLPLENGDDGSAEGKVS